MAWVNHRILGEAKQMPRTFKISTMERCGRRQKEPDKQSGEKP